jgi:tetratricopeptide (TPR) repeat protein
MRRSGRMHCGSASICGGPPSGRTRGGVYGRGGRLKAVITVLVVGWGLVWLDLGNAYGADTCGGKIAGSWDVTADTVFPATLVMPGRQLFKWEFKSDGPLGGDALLLPAGERRRYSCQGNSYTLKNFWGITLTLSPDGRRLDGECRDLVSAAGGGCHIHAVRKSGPSSDGPASAESTSRSPQADDADTCGGKIAGSWDVTADTVFPATLVMPGRQLFKWEFKSDGPLGGDALLLPVGERRRYSCQGNSYTLENFWGITLTLSPDGRRLDGECRDLVSAAGGGCHIHAVRKSGPPSVEAATAQSTSRSPQLRTTTAPTSPIPSATSSPDTRDAPASYAKGNSFFAANRYDLAEQSYSAAIAAKPDAPHYLSRGHARLALLKYNEAWEDYDRAIELRPDYAPSYLARGTLYWLLGRNLLAEDDLRAAIRLEPDNDFYYQRLAVILREGEKKQEITDTYRDAFTKDPTRPWALEGWLGGLWKQKKYDEILRIYFEYKDRNVYTGWLYYYAAQVFKERSNQQSAREMFLHAILHNDSDELLPIETYSAIAELDRDMALRQECLSHRSQYKRRMGRPDDGRQWCYERK